MKPYLFAFDPGQTTGWAIYETASERVKSGEDDFDLFCERMELLFAAYGADLDVTGERFTITAATAKKTQQPWSIEVIGVAKYLAHKFGCGTVTLQSPADAKRFGTNERLKNMGWWVPGTAGHDKDALRHLMVRMVNLGWSDRRLLSQ
jgi:hypothetical protein